MGRSNYTFRHLARDLIYDITSNSAFPLILVRDLGIFSFIISILLGLFYLVRYFIYGVSVEGWTTLVLLILAYNGIILLAIGIIGQYLMNILNEAKKMPNYVIRKKRFVILLDSRKIDHERNWRLSGIRRNVWRRILS